jgi:hypothetical protein
MRKGFWAELTSIIGTDELLEMNEITDQANPKRNAFIELTPTYKKLAHRPIRGKPKKGYTPRI